MLSCPRCGAPCQPHHKFCGSCAAPIQAQAPGAAAPPVAPTPAPPGPPGPGLSSGTEAGFGPLGMFPPTPPHGSSKVTPPPAPYEVEFPAPPAAAQPPPSAPAAGTAPSSRGGSVCQLGHEIAPGYSYCPMGHPLALDAVRVAGADQFSPPAIAPTPFAPPVQRTSPRPTGPMAGYPAAPPGGGFGGPVASAAQPPSTSPMTAPGPGPSARRGERRQLAGFLVSFHKDPLGAFFPLYAGANQVGRAGASDDLDVAIGDPATSSNHATIHADPVANWIAVEDLGSTNGTIVNDERLAYQGRRDLRDGDRIRFGSYTVKLILVHRG